MYFQIVLDNNFDESITKRNVSAKPKQNASVLTNNVTDRDITRELYNSRVSYLMILEGILQFSIVFLVVGV